MKCGQVDKVHIMVRNTPPIDFGFGGKEGLTKKGDGPSIFKESLEIRQSNLDLLGFHFLINT